MRQSGHSFLKLRFKGSLGSFLMKCEQCGAETECESVFRKIRSGLIGTKTICPTCLEFKRHKNGNKVITDFIGGLVLASFFLLNEKAPWYFINLYLVVAMMYLSIVPHELGHALGVLLTRHKILDISFGQGRRLYCTKIYGVYLEFRIVPVVGRVRYLRQNGCALRMKDLLIYTMGPATNIALFFLLWHGFGETIANENFNKTPAPLFAFTWANLFLGITNFLPFKYQTGRGKVTSDGLSILNIVFGKKIDIAGEIEQILFRASLAFYYNDYEECKNLAKKAVNIKSDDNRGHSYYGVAAGGLGDYEEAIRVHSQLLANPDMDAGMKAITESNLAYYYLLMDDPSNFSKALELAESAMAVCPWELSVRSNYGGLHVVAGDVDKGIDVLNDKRFAMYSNKARAEIHCLLAVGRAKKGQVKLAETELDMARKLDSKCVFLPRASAALGTC